MNSNIRFDSQNDYAYIGVFKNMDYEPYTLIIDTNTAINLERFYYNPASLVQKDKPYGHLDRNKKWKYTMYYKRER